MKNLLLVTLLMVFAIVSFGQTKKILLEELTTTLCGFCPPKSIDLERLADSTDEVIIVVHHAGFGKDAMTCPPATAFASAFAPNHFPSMTIDRIKFDSVPGYYTKKVGVSMMAFKWADTSIAILNHTSPKATVEIEKQFNQSTREISGNIKVKFISQVNPGDLRINLYIIEDSVVGDTGNYDYDQKNYATNDPKYPELKGKSLIYYKAHNDVLRAAPLGDWGASGVIPANPVVGTVYSKSFQYTLPQKYDNVKGNIVEPHRIYLVAFVSYYDADTWKRNVLNAEKVNLTGQGSSMIEKTENSYNISVYPNPANEFTNVNFNLSNNSDIKIELYNQTGQQIAILAEAYYESGNYRLTVNTALLNQGVYYLKIEDNNQQHTTKIVVVH